jgi:hypothetical protein
MHSNPWRWRASFVLIGAIWASPGCRQDPIAPVTARAPAGLVEVDTLRHDDGVPEGTWGIDALCSFAAVFENPFDTPARIEAVWVYLLGCAPAGAPYRMAIWDVDEDGRPTASAAVGPGRFVGPPLDAWSIDTNFDLVVAAHARFAAGVEQFGPQRLCLGHDYTSPFHLATHWFAALGRPTGWSAYEALDPPILVVPMLRVMLSPVADNATSQRVP